MIQHFSGRLFTWNACSHTATAEKFEILRSFVGNTLFATDMDGTLIDSQKAVIESYKSVGVHNAEENFGKPWQEWCPEDKHEAKKKVYEMKLLEFGKRTAFCSDIISLRPLILTGASDSAFHLVNKNFLRYNGHFQTGMSVDDKIHFLKALRSGWYFEDQPVIAKRVS